MRTIASVATDGSGNYTIFNLTTPWAITPATGDVVVICATATNPEHGTPQLSALNGSVSGVVATVSVKNMTAQTWLFLVRTENAEWTHGPDSLAPMRELYLYGSGGTRTITTNTTMSGTDGLVKADCSVNNTNITYTCLPFADIPNQQFTVSKIDNTSYTVTVVCASGDTFTDGSTSTVLSNQGDSTTFKVSA
jgi:hypothetical protein